METSAKLALLGGLGAVAYWWMTKDDVTPSIAIQPATGPAAVPSTVPPGVIANTTVAPPSNNYDQILLNVLNSWGPNALTTAAKNAGYPAPQNFTVSQWNWFFERTTGGTPVQLGDSGQPMSIDTYWNALRQYAIGGRSGLAGLRGWRG